MTQILKSSSVPRWTLIGLLLAAIPAPANDPAPILADEPTGHLDSTFGRNAFNLMRLTDQKPSCWSPTTRDLPGKRIGSCIWWTAVWSRV